MSRTDKDRPLWVQNAEHGHIDHDHRAGECIISNDQRDRWPAWRHHWRKCKKRVCVEYTCTKDDPNFNRGSWRNPPTQTCWTWVCDERVQCIGHSRIEHDNSIPCSCDNKPEPATCTPAWDIGRYYTWGGVPSWFVNSTYHSPERRRARDELRDMVREYNAYGDLEDGDYFSRPARNSARWDWW